MTVVLERSYLPHCTIGRLHIPFQDTQKTFATIERPWLSNQANISCIPEGIYDVVPHNGSRFKGVWKLEDVPDRSYILIHAGNYSKDVQGCIAVGQYLSDDNYMVMNSRHALNELRDLLPPEFQIVIKTYRPDTSA